MTFAPVSTTNTRLHAVPYYTFRTESTRTEMGKKQYYSTKEA